MVSEERDDTNEPTTINQTSRRYEQATIGGFLGHWTLLLHSMQQSCLRWGFPESNLCLIQLLIQRHWLTCTPYLMDALYSDEDEDDCLPTTTSEMKMVCTTESFERRLDQTPSR